jgi:hypothetical protein
MEVEAQDRSLWPIFLEPVIKLYGPYVNEEEDNIRTVFKRKYTLVSFLRKMKLNNDKLH